MANQITKYTNGTFEGAQGTWNEAYGAGVASAIRDTAVFYEGTASVRMTTVAIGNPAFSYGTAQLLQCTFPKNVTNFKITARIRCSSGIPNDAVFFINPQIDPSKPGFLVPVRASTCKAEFVELSAYYWMANLPAVDTFFTIDVMWNSQAFAEQLSFNPQYESFYQNVLNFSASTPIPAGEFVWVDLMFSDVSVVPAQPNIQFQGRKLYYVQNVFYLNVGGARTVVDEPIKWDDVNIQVIFDEKTRAYRFEFSDKDVILEFDVAAGGDILSEQYRLNGTNADVVLEFGEYDPIANELTILYSGQINFAECSEDEFYFKANIERMSFNDKLRTYFDTKTDVFRNMSLGGLARPELERRDLYLHPRLLSFVAEYEYNDNIPVEQELTVETSGLGAGGKVYAAYPGMKTIKNNISELVNDINPTEFGRMIYAGSSLPAGVTKRKFFIEGGFSFRYTKTGSVQQPRAGFGIQIVNNVSLGNTPEGQSFGANSVDKPSYSELGGILAGTYEVSGTFSGFAEIGPDDALFFRAAILNPVGGDPDAVYSDFEWFDTHTFYLRWRELTVFAPSLIRVPLVHDVVNRQLELIVDKANVLKSTLFGRTDLGYPSDGCAAMLFMMDGKMIRELPGNPDNNNLPVLNLGAKDWFNPLNGLHCLGMSVERDENDVESVRLEGLEYFFRDVLLINLEVISDYERRPATEYLFNEITARFTKYPQDNQQDSLEDFMTQMDYITPLKRVKNKLSIDIAAILSGNYIEYTRREGFKNNPTNAYETDNDLFIIAGKQSPVSAIGASIIFDDEEGTITVMSAVGEFLPAVAQDNITIANGTGSVTNGTYPIVNVEIPFTYDRVILYIATDLPSTGSGTGDVTIVDVNSNPVTRYIAERDEDFAEVIGVTQPKSVYNLKYHLKRVVLNWAKVFQAGWNFLVTGEFSNEGISFVQGKNNIGVVTELDPGATCKFGDSIGGDRADRGAVRVSEMDEPLFGKDIITYRAPLTWTAFNFIRYAFEGRNPEGRNYGYIQIRNPKNKLEKTRCLQMKFDPNGQMCKFITIEKHEKPA
jgi:hypothetical protein